VNQMSIDCITQHIKMFHQQAVENRVADFGEPCCNCMYREKCNYNWLSKMNPVLSQSNVKISMLIREPEGIPDSDRIDPDVDTHQS
jgi:hypothetical protein